MFEVEEPRAQALASIPGKDEPSWPDQTAALDPLLSFLPTEVDFPPYLIVE